MIRLTEEAGRCLLCADAPCTQSCPKGFDPGRAVRAIRFDNSHNAFRWITGECSNCSAPCEDVCIHPDRPIRIKELSAAVSQRPDPVTQEGQPSTLPSLEIDFCGVHCENPFFLASSAICTNYDMVARAFDMGWGGVVFKTMTTIDIKEVSPRFDTIGKQGMPFSGFRNMEQLSENTLEENLAIIRRLKEDYPSKIVVASIMGQTEQEWIDLAKACEEAKADMVELNFSCPQMKLAGTGSDVGQNPELVIFFTSYVKNAVNIPVIAKMTPNITHISQPAMAAYFAGADSIAAINTIKSVTMSEGSMVNGKRTVSGYSGNAVKPIALKHILDIATNPLLKKYGKSPEISGIGGIETWRDALEYIQLGCSNVQVCTSVMQYGYRIIDDLLLGMQTYMADHGIQSVSELVGSELHTFVRPSAMDRATVVYPKFNAEKCIGCGRCYISCSDAGHQAIRFGSDRRPHLIGKNCVGCHLCRLICQQGAIGISKRVEKKSTDI